MGYSVEYSDKALKQLGKLDKHAMRLIMAWIEKNLIGCEDPRRQGRELTANHSGQWRYRIGDYRLLVNIRDEKLVILALAVGHRKNVY